MFFRQALAIGHGKVVHQIIDPARYKFDGTRETFVSWFAGLNTKLMANLTKGEMAPEEGSTWIFERIQGGGLPRTAMQASGNRMERHKPGHRLIRGD